MDKNDIIELSRARRIILKAIKLSLSIGLPYYLFVLLTNKRIPCLFFELTGLQCSGCGITRMFMSIARLELRDAFGHNPFAFVLLFLLAALSAGMFFGKPKFLRSRLFLKISGITIAVLALLFAVFRNIC